MYDVFVCACKSDEGLRVTELCEIKAGLKCILHPETATLGVPEPNKAHWPPSTFVSLCFLTVGVI